MRLLRHKGDRRSGVTFLGTRGEIEICTRRHHRHSSLLVRLGSSRIMVDCGRDWLGQLERVSPTAIVLTHAHPDHAAGLAKGAPCPVYATEQTWDVIRSFPIADRRVVPSNRDVRIGGVRFKATAVEHSIRAPAVGWRVVARGLRLFYVPDVARIPDVRRALRGIGIYIGDGATFRRAMVRKRNGCLIGHASILAQLGWCERAGVRRAIFTHCGSSIVRGDATKLNAELRRIARQHGIEACFACDGEMLSFPSAGPAHAPRRAREHG